MRLFTVITFFLVTLVSYAQTGFIQSHDLEEAGMTFHNMLLVEDTLMVFGSVGVEDLQQWGLVFLKMDTSGNILEEHRHFDTLGDNYSFEQRYKVIKTTDEGYALVGQMFGRQFPILIKLDQSGNREFVKEYPDTTVYDIRHWNIIETEHGYISAGVKQQMDDGVWDTFIMGTDQRGNKRWEITYGEYNLWDNLEGIQKLNENEFLITGYTANSSSQVSNIADLWTIPRAIKIDTLGQILWEWEGEQVYVGTSSPSFRHLFPTTDGNWVNMGATSTLLSDNEIAFNGEIVKRDTAFNVIWSTAFGWPTSNLNGFFNMAASPDGGWVAVGRYIESLPDDPNGGYRASMIAKVDVNGDSLWSRLDTLFDPSIIASRPYLAGVVVLPSGSVITCGRVDQFFPGPGKSYGWLIKVDKDGCMEPGCNPATSSTNLAPVLADFKVYPNPVVDRVSIRGTGEYGIELLDAHGRILQTKSHIYETITLDMRGYPAGSYFVRVKRGNTWLMKKLMKL